MSSISSRAYNIFDLREMAQRRLPRGIFEFVDRGAEDEVTLRNNRAAIERIKLKPRVLADVSQRGQEITLLGKRQKMPIAIAPTGAAGIMWHEGEIALARAAAAAGIPFTLATASMTAMDKIAVLRELWPCKLVLKGILHPQDAVTAVHYGVAADGEPGAARAIAIFREEIDRVLALLRCRSIAELSRAYLVLPETMREPAAAGHRVGLRLLDSARAAGEM